MDSENNARKEVFNEIAKMFKDIEDTTRTLPEVAERADGFKNFANLTDEISTSIEKNDISEYYVGTLYRIFTMCIASLFYVVLQHPRKLADVFAFLQEIQKEDFTPATKDKKKLH